MSNHKKVDIMEDVPADEHMKAMWAGQSNVLVAVRVRPLMKHDQVKKSCVRVLDSKVVVIMDPATDKADILRANRSREKQYAFDFVFDPSAKQEHVYHTTTKFLIHGVLDGYNATVFAYGQTGSGKTHTMIGSQADEGIMVRVMEDLFVHSANQGKAQGTQYKVTVSFLEVYNENIRDLLSDVEEYLDLREDPIKGPVVASITEIETTSGKEVMGLLHQGNAKRSQAATAANEVSSRSHAVLQVVVECRDRAPGTVANIKVGKLSLVDLAGSERAANTKNIGARLVEGANINRSLLALGNCINALGEKGNKGNFVPYRDSKLTRLLKDSLGGNCRTVMIANISSAESSFEETLNTLKYANRAKNIKTNVQRNVLNVNYHISEYVELINNLRNEIQILKSQIGPDHSAEVNHSASHVHLHHHDVLPDLNEAPVQGPGGLRILTPLPSPHIRHPTTPFLRESLRSGVGLRSMGAIGGIGIGALGAQTDGREVVNAMRQRIVDNFQERMQLRRSLIELEDQNVQNSIEVSKRQLLVVGWSEDQQLSSLTKADFHAYITTHGTPDVLDAWQECEQLKKAILKNNNMKKNIAKRLKGNEKEAEKCAEELTDITGEDRRELMGLQYQVGRLELENMELEQHRIVHESILKGKDLVIQKLQLQLAVRDKVIARQLKVLEEHGLAEGLGMGGYEGVLGDSSAGMTGITQGMSGMSLPMSPPRNMKDLHLPPGSGKKAPPVPALPIKVANPRRGAYSSCEDTSDDNDGDEYEQPRGSSNAIASGSLPNGTGATHLSNVTTTSLAHSDSESRFRGNRDHRTEEDIEEVDDEYNMMPFTERDGPHTTREVALTSRDRDLIEEGEWAEIQSELSDNSFSFSGGNPQAEHGKRYRAKEKKKVNKKDKGAAAKAVQVAVVPIAQVVPEKRESKVHGPRGGRLYRSSVEDRKKAAAEDSDEDQLRVDPRGNLAVAGNNPGPAKGKFRHYNSPRKDNKDSKDAPAREAMPPLQGHAEEVGVLSGRRLQDLIRDRDRNSDLNVSPRAEGYAAVYPADEEPTRPKGLRVKKGPIGALIGGGGGGGGGSNMSSDASLITIEGLAAGVNLPRPTNRFKPSRPLKAVKCSAVADEEDYDLGKIKSLPLLSKQPSQQISPSPRAAAGVGGAEQK